MEFLIKVIIAWLEEMKYRLPFIVQVAGRLPIGILNRKKVISLTGLIKNFGIEINYIAIQSILMENIVVVFVLITTKMFGTLRKALRNRKFMTF